MAARHRDVLDYDRLHSQHSEMNLQQLRCVFAIADNGLNITAAANQLHTCQPQVSKHLQLLEKELGVQIFIRNGRSLSRATAAGGEIIRRARVIMREVEELLGSEFIGNARTASCHGSPPSPKRQHRTETDVVRSILRKMSDKLQADDDAAFEIQ